MHERFSSPLYPFAFVLVAVAFVGQSQTTRQNRVQAIVSAFMLSAGSRLVGLAGINLVNIRPSNIWIPYAIPIGIIILGLLIAQNGMRPRRQSKLGQLVSVTGDWIGSAVASRFRRRAAASGQR